MPQSASFVAMSRKGLFLYTVSSRSVAPEPCTITTIGASCSSGNVTTAGRRTSPIRRNVWVRTGLGEYTNCYMDNASIIAGGLHSNEYRRNVLADNVTAQVIADEKRFLFLHINDIPIAQRSKEQFGIGQSESQRKGIRR